MCVYLLLPFDGEQKNNVYYMVTFGPCRAYFKKNLVLHNEELSLEGTMASAEREPITEVWGGAPSGVQEQSTWSGGEAPWSWWHFYTQSAFPALFLWHFALVQRLQISVNNQYSESCTESYNYNSTNCQLQLPIFNWQLHKSASTAH